VSDADWESRIARLWASIDAHEPDEFVRRVEALARELPEGSGVALFERACAQDSTGHSDRAVPLYEAALAAGLSGIRRRRAVIQMASSLRNLGHASRSVELLRRELDAGHDELDGAVRGFLALALVDCGRAGEASGQALLALATYLPRYNRSLARYAQELIDAGK
jgi:hypothetical protein